MKRQVRRMVFETNSSSTHSLSIVGSEIFEYKNPLHLYYGEFGWGYDLLNTPSEIASYALTMFARHSDSYEEVQNREKVKWLLEAISSHTGYEQILPKPSNDGYYPFGYVDHQSSDTLDDFDTGDEEVFKQNMINLIFNPSTEIIIDNDNH